MEDSTHHFDSLTLRLDNDNEELNALTLTTLLNSGVEEALSNLSPAQLIQLEKNVQKLKKQKSTSSASMPLAGSGAGSARGSLTGKSTPSGRKRRQSSGEPMPEGVIAEDVRPRPSGGQYMNLPASAPQVEFRDGAEWLHFTYSTKGHIQEYVIRVDIDDLTLEEIPEDFKHDQCVYPRALIPRESYVGNRWEYETSVNELAWKLCWRNPGVLCGKRGLIQRAVDSYRNRTPENRSRRVMRQEKLGGLATGGKMNRRMTGLSPSPEEAAMLVPGPKTMTLQYANKDGELQKLKVRVDIENVDLQDLDAEFRQNNAVYPQALMERELHYAEGDGRWEYEQACNEIAWKLAWLNAPKLAGKRSLLQKAVDAYHSRLEAANRARSSVLRHSQEAMAMPIDAAAHAIDPNELAAAYHSYTQLHPPQQHRQHLAAAHAAAAAQAHAGMYGYYHHHGQQPQEEEEAFSQMVAHTLQHGMAQGYVDPNSGAAVYYQQDENGSPVAAGANAGYPADYSQYASHHPDMYQLYHHHHVHHQDDGHHHHHHEHAEGDANAEHAELMGGLLH